MSGAENNNQQRWTFGVRVIPGTVARASLRTTMTYRFTPRLTAGIELNPRAETTQGQVSPLLNYLVVRETERRPAVIVGTSSDRIGTPEGQSFYATLSKNLKRETGLPIAPYAGAAYSTHDHRWRAIGGLNVQFTEKLSATVIFDGVRVHPLLNYIQGRHAFTFILAFANKPGFSYSISF